MRLWSRPGLVAALGLGLGLFALLHRPGTVSGFTQGVKGGGRFVPIGHEWITRQAAIELLDSLEKKDGADDKKDLTDPRNGKDWKPVKTNLSVANAMSVVDQIKSNKRSDSLFQPRYSAVYDAILGERWVDIGGINFTKAKLGSYNCIDLVTQEPTDVQYDHFMRQWDDVDGAGGVNAALQSRTRFIDYFVAAAMAADGPMRVWDGGAYSNEHTVDRHYFLFGRALHLLEDSFSADHTVRIKDDGYQQVRQVKSYLCAEGSEQHAHLQPPGDDFYKTGDVIWEDIRDESYKPSNMKPLALAATEATKEAWAAFIRSMAVQRNVREAAARREATAVADNWLSFKQQEMIDWYKQKGHQDATYVKAGSATESAWGGTPQADCMKRDWDSATQKKKLQEFEDGREMCIYNMVPREGTENDRDSRLHIPFLWDWRPGKTGDTNWWQSPPKGFKVGEVDSAKTRITLINKHEKAPLCGSLPELRMDNQNPRCAPLQFAVDAQHLDSTLIESVDLPSHYFAEHDGNHHVQLYTKGRTFRFKRRTDGYYNIVVMGQNGQEGHHLYSQDGHPILNGIDANNERALWQVSGLPESDLAKGLFNITAVVAGEERSLTLGAGNVLMIGAKVDPQERAPRFHSLDGEKNLYKVTFMVQGEPPRLVRENKQGTHRLEVIDKSGDSFRFTSPRRDGYWYIQTGIGSYWGVNGESGPIETNSVMPCGQDPHKVLSGNGDECGKNGRPMGPVPLLFRFKQIFP